MYLQCRRSFSYILDSYAVRKRRKCPFLCSLLQFIGPLLTKSDVTKMSTVGVFKSSQVKSVLI